MYMYTARIISFIVGIGIVGDFAGGVIDLSQLRFGRTRSIDRSATAEQESGAGARGVKRRCLHR